MEALYSTLCNGSLLESSVADQGERFVPEAPGVYFHKDMTQYKADHYLQFVQFPPYDTFWAIKWEVKVFRPKHVRPLRSTDQWIQPASTVKLVALWVCAREAMHMEHGAVGRTSIKRVSHTDRAHRRVAPGDDGTRAARGSIWPFVRWSM